MLIKSNREIYRQECNIVKCFICLSDYHVHDIYNVSNYIVSICWEAITINLKYYVVLIYDLQILTKMQTVENI